MSLLELKDIGKIYVSENTVSVGIRGVNLSFDKGEFVAITGQSGSGKSTLLNVISGMDSYEEGELYIEGNETSHYIQPDWEKYREKYISFIFQEYNIIDSFTVLENVELSLMHIGNAKERRERAMELIRRVGLEEHIGHKGSHLSGGQKQRTVIARALAKDSPIILADEPTGNLDSNTSNEIIQLLKEVSRDKLLIVVTHNFEEVEAHATREIRVYDGAVASDRIISDKLNVSADGDKKELQDKEQKHKTVRNSLDLGWSIFKAKPNLSTFMCMLIALAATVIFFTFASFWADIKVFFVDDHYMFSNVKGRVVITTEDGSAITEDELKELADKTGAKDTLHYDLGLDLVPSSEWTQSYSNYEWWRFGEEPVNITYGKDYGELSIGRYPESEYEVVLRMPYFMRERYGENEIVLTDFTFKGTRYGSEASGFNCRVVGISYYQDSAIQGEILMTKSGYEAACALRYINKSEHFMVLKVGDYGTASFTRLTIDNSVPVGVVQVGKNPAEEEFTGLDIAVMDMSEGSFRHLEVGLEEKDYVTNEELSINKAVVNFETIKQGIIDFMQNNYSQASLIYSSNSAAKAAARELKDLGYVSVPATTTYKVANYMEIIEMVVMGVVYLSMWTLILIFLAFFIRICTKKSMDAFKSDIAIMRSMGIRVIEIKAAIVFRIAICMIPSMIALPIFASWLYKTDFGGRNLVYMRVTEYVIMFLLLGIVVMRVTKKHIANLFSENVRKALKGDNE